MKTYKEQIKLEIEAKIESKIEALKSDSNFNKLHLICDLSKLMRLEELDEKVRFTPIPKVDVDKFKSIQDKRAEIKQVVQKLKSSSLAPSVQDLAKKIEENAKSVVLVVNKNNILTPNRLIEKIQIQAEDLSERKVNIGFKKFSFHKDLDLNPQKSAHSMGTGFLFIIDDRLFAVTAAHVVFGHSKDFHYRNLRFVSDFAVRDDHQFDNIVTVSKKFVFQPIVQKFQHGENYYLSSFGGDYAIIEIEPVFNAEPPWKEIHPLTKDDLFSNSSPKEGKIDPPIPIYGIGHGFGLPQKLSSCGDINEYDENQLFRGNMDSYRGNSGTPIFDTKSHQLIAMAIRGRRNILIDTATDTVYPSGLDYSEGREGSEVFQNIDFLRNFIPPEQPLEVDEKGSENYLELLPFVRLEKVAKGVFHLYLCFSVKERTIHFKKQANVGAITYLEWDFDIGDKGEESLEYKRIILERPQDEDTSDNTIEIKVTDQITGVTHTTILDFENSIDLSKNGANSNGQDNDFVINKIYWASGVPESSFVKNQAEKIGISLGYFDKTNNFVKSKMVEKTLQELKGAHLKWNQDTNKIETVEVDNHNDQSLYISSTLSRLFEIPKPDNIGGRTKPSGFLFL